jgi:hypothetical protein
MRFLIGGLDAAGDEEMVQIAMFELECRGVEVEIDEEGDGRREESLT